MTSEDSWAQATREDNNLPGSRTEIRSEQTKNERMRSLADGMDMMMAVVSADEAERIVDSLESCSVEDVGSSSFLYTFGYQVERLSMQAHITAQQQQHGGSNSGLHNDEYVVERILASGKLTVLIRTLLAVEAWRLYVLQEQEQGQDDSLASQMAQHGNALRCAFILHVETTLVGLLNLIFYRKESCEQMDGEAAIALVDYCSRSMASLAVPVSENEMVRRQKEPATAIGMTARSRLEEMKDARLDTEYRTAVSAVSLARHLCEHFDSLVLGAQTRILDTHDFLVMMTPLIDEPPWTRRRKILKGGMNVVVWEKYMDHKWTEVPASDLLEITKCEAQCWLTIFHLTCNSVCRKQYGLNVFRKEQLLRLRKYLNDIVLDQLPVLVDVMRYMDELSLMSVSESVTGHGSALLMQQVPMMRDALIRGRDWTKVAQQQFDDVFSTVTDATDLDLKLISSVYQNSDVEQTIMGQIKPFIFQTQPIDSAVLTVDSKGIRMGTFRLTPNGEGTVTNTPCGPFRRIKLTIFSMSQTEEEMAHPIPSKSKAICRVTFGGGIEFESTLECKDLDLPCEPQTTTVWKQMGSIEEKLIIQLGFKQLSDATNPQGSYNLCQAFVSQPISS